MSNLSDLRTALDAYVSTIETRLNEGGDVVTGGQFAVIDETNDLEDLRAQLNIPDNSWLLVRWTNGSPPLNLPPELTGAGYAIVMVFNQDFWTIDVTTRSRVVRKWTRTMSSGTWGTWVEHWHSGNLQFNYNSSTGVLDIVTG